MNTAHDLTRRTALLGGFAAAGTLSAAGVASARPNRRPPLWRQAQRRGIVYGSSTATWQLSDAAYRDLFEREAGILFTEDDLLWYRLRPTPESELDFSFGDEIVAFAETNQMLVFGAHLVWDEGFGEGWTEEDLWEIGEHEARDLLFGTVDRVVRHYRGRIAAWSVANEVTDPEGDGGFRTDVPWYHTIGPSYVAEAFHLARQEDPDTLLVLNEFGFETVNEWGDQPGDRRRATLQVIDALLADDVPVQALGVQAHLLAGQFAERFDTGAYRRFLAEVADRGLRILITELDVLDDGLPAAVGPRDQAVAEVYRRYLDTALEEPAVTTLITFGLSDRYTWLEEDYPRDDGAPRRPLPFDADLEPKPAYDALSRSLRHAPRRRRRGASARSTRAARA